MFKVKIKNKTYLAEENELLSDILVRNGLKLPHICGGRGVCGKCTVNVNGRDELSCKYKIKVILRFCYLQTKIFCPQSGLNVRMF